MTRYSEILVLARSPQASQRIKSLSAISRDDRRTWPAYYWKIIASLCLDPRSERCVWRSSDLLARRVGVEPEAVLSTAITVAMSADQNQRLALGVSVFEALLENYFPQTLYRLEQLEPNAAKACAAAVVYAWPNSTSASAQNWQRVSIFLTRCQQKGGGFAAGMLKRTS